MFFLYQAYILITGCNNIHASSRSCGSPAGAQFTALCASPWRPSEHIQSCLAHGEVSDFCSFLRWPCFFLLLLLWKVGRSRQEMQGRGGELSSTLNEVLGSVDPTPLSFPRPRQTFPKCSWLTLQSPTPCWETFLSVACSGMNCCPLPLPFAYFYPLLGKKGRKRV